MWPREKRKPTAHKTKHRPCAMLQTGLRCAPHGWRVVRSMIVLRRWEVGGLLRGACWGCVGHWQCAELKQSALRASTDYLVSSLEEIIRKRSEPSSVLIPASCLTVPSSSTLDTVGTMQFGLSASKIVVTYISIASTITWATGMLLIHLH